MKGTAFKVVAVALAACCLYTHRRVIAAVVNGDPIPQAPSWHVWVKNRKA